MTKLTNALEQLRSWADRNKAVLDLAEALRGVGSVEQLAAEAEARLADVNARLDSATKELVGQRALVEQAKATAAEMVTSAEAEAKALLDSAHESASTAVENANAIADGVLSAAQAKAAAIENEAQKKAADLQAEAERAKELLAALQAQVEVVSAELTDTEGRLAAAKDAVQKLLA